jgi:hypothetical protein
MSFWTGENPPGGAILSYHLREPAREARLVIERDGTPIRTLDVSGEPGVIHRVVWDLRYEPFDEGEEGEDDAVPGLPRPVGPRGPLVAPGPYTVTLEADGHRYERELVVRRDPRMPTLTGDDYRAREAFLLAVRALRTRARAHSEPAPDSARSELERIDRDARSLERELEGGSVQPGTLYPPTPAQRERLEALEARLTDLTDGSQERAEPTNTIPSGV